MANAKHLASPAGILQIVHLIFGAVAIGCGAASYESQFVKERFFFWTVVTLLIVSVILLVVNVITGHAVVKVMSSGLHVVGGVILLAAGTLMILSVKTIENDHCAPNPWDADCNFDKPTKLAAASFAIINGIFYLFVSVLIFMVKQEEDDVGYLQAERSFGRPKA